MGPFVTIVKDKKPLDFVTKSSVLDVTVVLDPALLCIIKFLKFRNSSFQVTGSACKVSKLLYQPMEPCRLC